jgi:hypothetical protein
MDHKHFLVHAVLWASAIVASAIVGAPRYFSIVLLPGLAMTALIVAWPKTRTDRS